jgi:hypothetical protein
MEVATMITTDVRTCKERMSTKGFKLFCKHKKEDDLDPWNPDVAPDEEIVCLSKLEVFKYEY